MPLDTKQIIDESDEGPDTVKNSDNESRDQVDYQLSAPASRRPSDDDESARLQHTLLVDEKAKSCFMLYHTFQLPSQSGITTVTKLNATETTGERILIACRDDSVYCAYFVISTEDNSGLQAIIPKCRLVSAIALEKPWKICALSSIRHVGLDGARKDIIASIMHCPKHDQDSETDEDVTVMLTLITADAEDISLECPIYRCCELSSPPYGCNPVIWRPLYRSSSYNLVLMVPNQNAWIHCVSIDLTTDSFDKIEFLDSFDLPEADYTSEKPIGAIEFWDSADGLSRITAVARGCRSEIRLEKYNFLTKEKYALWMTQHDSMTQKLRFFHMDPQHDKIGLLVLGLGELSVVYSDIDTTSLPKSIILPESDRYDMVTSCEVADINHDSFPEIILGTYGKVALIYKITHEEATLLHVIEVASPIYFVSFANMTKNDDAFDLVLVTQKESPSRDMELAINGELSSAASLNSHQILENKDLSPSTSQASINSETAKCSTEELLIYSARTSNLPLVKEILANRRISSVNINHLGTLKWNRGNSALHIGSYFGNTEVVRILLAQSDIDVNIRNNHCETALHKAALTGRLNIVQALLAAGADVFLTDNRGRKAADLAELYPDISRLINDMERVQTDNQVIIFLAACRDGNFEQMRKILDGPHPPDIQNIDIDGNSALHYAVIHDQKEAASLLLQHGCDPNQKNSRGKSCFDLVLSDQMQRILEIRLPMKGVPKCQGKEGTLLKCNRIWNMWRKNEVCLHKGTISFYRHKKDIGNEKLRRAYKHLDGANVHKGKRWSDFYIRFTEGSTFWLRILKSSNPVVRDEWMDAIQEHIAYCNYYIGIVDPPSDDHKKFIQSTEKAFSEARNALEKLLRSVAHISSESSHTRGSALLEITQAGEHAYGALQHCLETLREQDKLRENQLFDQRERCRVLENALQVLAHEHEAVLSSMEHLATSGSISSANSVYFSPPESVADLADVGLLDDVPQDDLQSMFSAEDTMPESSGDDDTNGISDKQTETVISGESADGAIMLPNGSGNVLDVLSPRSKFGGRSSLPVPQFSRADFSIWSVLKQCIGKDLSKITMPVVFNEPLSFLQRMSEYMEYAHLLDQASICEDPVDRILYISAFAISACASNADRLGKPFNPLLGETFELSRPELGYRMICEQVSHHPPISAFDASTSTWHFYGSILPKLKFWGKSVEIQPKGTVTLELKKFREAYSWSNVNCQVNNIIVGKLWIEQYGTMEVINRTTGLSAVLNFHPSGWMSRDMHRVTGFVVDRNKNQLRAIFGKWTEFVRCSDIDVFERHTRHGSRRKSSVDLQANAKSMSRQHSTVDAQSLSDRIENTLNVSDFLSYGEDIPESRLLWQIDPRPPNSSKYYGFTVFAMGLNELEEGMKKTLAPTDCRFRPDMRALENGDLDGASNEKNRLEEKQRAARKLNQKQSRKEDWAPLWFNFQRNPHTGAEDWIFNGKYWDRDFCLCPEIY